jgi:hypothetical protein
MLDVVEHRLIDQRDGNPGPVLRDNPGRQARLFTL